MIQSRAQFGYFGVLWQIAYAPYVSDYSRYMPPDNQAGSTFWMSYWGTVLGSTLPMLLGAVVGVASSNPDQIAELHTFLANYTNFILLLLYVLIPWTAINLVDYYLIRHGDYDVEAFFDPTGGPYGRVGTIGIVAYIIGILVEIPFMSTTLYTGPAASAMNGTDLSWIVGLVVTVPLYYLLAVRQRTRRPAAAPEPARN
jgi:purine-cytosine permease-like protein